MVGRLGVFLVILGGVCALPRNFPPIHAQKIARKTAHFSKRLIRPINLPPESRRGIGGQRFPGVHNFGEHATSRIDEPDPEVTPGFYQGDMVGLREEGLEMNTRVALKWEVFPEKKWKNGTVHYHISKLYGPSETVMIERAINTLRFMTCIKFIEWDGVTEDYLLIYPVKHPRGCWSYVGRRGKQQVLSLQPPSSRSKGCFASLGKPIHEILHALGIFHEQARPDRDEYVTIITENIVPYYMQNFMKLSAENTTFPYAYDYSSVMHYGSDFFGYFRGQTTIEPKKLGVKIGQRLMLSKLDCLKINDLYGCLKDPQDKIKFTSFCNFLGIE